MLSILLYSQDPIFIQKVTQLALLYPFTLKVLYQKKHAIAYLCNNNVSLVANDIAPAYAGIIFGISNTFATIPGIISPYIVGTLTEKV